MEQIAGPLVSPNIASRSIIDVKNLVKVYSSSVEAVKGITFSVREGECFGFLGPNGAGKTTMVKILITLLARTSGTATILGYDVGKEKNQVRHFIGYAAQDACLDQELTAYENLAIQGNLYHMKKALLRERIDDLLELMELRDVAHRRVGTFSGGMRKRLDLACALIHSPRILFLDEPTTGLDPQSRRSVWKYLDQLNTHEKLTIVLTTHYMEEADKLCHRLAIIDEGKIIVEGSPAELKAQAGGEIITLSFQGHENAFLQMKELLEKEPFIDSITAGQGNSVILIVRNGHQHLPYILRLLEHAGLSPTSLNLTSPSLDNVFLKYTGTRMRQDDLVSPTGLRGRWRHRK